MNEAYSTIVNVNQYQYFFEQYGWLLILVFIWSLVWKGIALWHAARGSQRNWFIALLIVNTLGILEIIYLLGFKKPKN